MNPLISMEAWSVLAVLVTAGSGFVAWRTAHSLRVPLRAGVTAARMAGVVGVLLLILNLGQWRERVEQSAACWALLLDRSASMTSRDADESGSQTRWESAVETAREAVKAGEHPDRAHGYVFSDALRPTTLAELETLRPDGRDTRIVKVGRELLALEQGRKAELRGILLLSDGRQPAAGSPESFALLAAARAAPVYPLPLGGPVAARDLALRVPRLRQVSFLGQPVSLSGALYNEGMGPLQAKVALREAAGTPIAEQTHFATNQQTVSFHFELQPEKAGYYEYVIETEPRAGEADRANNRVGLGVLVLTERLNVFLLEGEPYWDTKFLSHLLRGQTNMAMNAVFRVSQDRFFRVSSDTELTSATSDVLPSTDEEMAKYDLVIIGRGSEYIIDDERARLLERFVRERGGCLFFARGKSYNGPESPLRDLEPVRWGKRVGSSFTLQPLLPGEQAGLFGGLLPGRDDPIWKELPPLERANRCEELASFASVLAEAVPSGGAGARFPAIVSRRCGRGLVLLVNGDGLWKWGFYPDVQNEAELYGNLWVRMFQWAVSFAEFTPGSDFAIHTDRGTVRAGEAVGIRVSTRGENGADPTIRVYHEEQSLETIALAPDQRYGLQWNGLLSGKEPGIYRLSVETVDGKPLGAQTTIQVLPPPGELDELSADPEFLERLAQTSGGRMITREEIPALVREWEAPRLTQRPGELEWDPAWDRAAFAFALMLCLALEWYWRRRGGLL